jgi:hypothetical protein
MASKTDNMKKLGLNEVNKKRGCFDQFHLVLLEIPIISTNRFVLGLKEENLAKSHVTHRAMYVPSAMATMEMLRAMKCFFY